MNRIIVVVMGMCASGKSTLTKQLVDMYPDEFIRVSAGDIVRELHKGLTKERREEDIRFINKYGLSKYDTEIRQGIYNKISSSSNKNIILDGYPRTVDQLKDVIDSYYSFMVVDLIAHPLVILRRMDERGRDTDIDKEEIIRAQSKNESQMLEYLKDISRDKEIPILTLDTTYSEIKDVKYAVKTVRNYLKFYEKNILEDIGRCGGD